MSITSRGVRSRWIFVLVLCALAGLSDSETCLGQAAGGPVPVKVAAVAHRKVAEGQAFVGTVTPSRRSIVGSAVAGRIVEFTHNEGDYVEEGEVLAQILTGTIEIELAQAKAELQVREAELQESVKSFPAEKQQADARLAAMRAKRDHAKSKLTRVLALKDKNNVSEEALDEARALALESDAAFQEAEATRRMIFDGAREQKIKRIEAQALGQKEAVRLIEDRLKKYTVRAYFGGYVTAELTEVGHWIKDGEPVVEIAELDQVDVRINVPEHHISDLEVGDAVRVEVNATRQKSFFGEVQAIVPQADLKARTFPVLVRLKNPRKNETDGRASKVISHELKSGMLARAILPVGKRREGLLVSKDAIVLGGRAPIVYVVDHNVEHRGQGTTRVVAVDLGAAVGGDIEVTAMAADQPLKSGDLVVVEGNERLRPGQAVGFEESAAGSAARD